MDLFMDKIFVIGDDRKAEKLSREISDNGYDVQLFPSKSFPEGKRNGEFAHICYDMIDVADFIMTLWVWQQRLNVRCFIIHSTIVPQVLEHFKQMNIVYAPFLGEIRSYMCEYSFCDDFAFLIAEDVEKYLRSIFRKTHYFQNLTGLILYKLRQSIKESFVSYITNDSYMFCEENKINFADMHPTFGYNRPRVLQKDIYNDVLLSFKYEIFSVKLTEWILATDKKIGELLGHHD